nr:16S rRNA (uracil(1498)-N(3))-methyltransferase [Actinomycetota bacterium]
MTPPLFLVPDLGSGDVIVLTGAEAHHAGTVKRLTVGERALLADGRGGLAEVSISAVEQDRVSCAVLHRRVLPEPSPRFVVVQALPKGDRAELAVEVLTELGVDEIVPWSAARSISVWKGDKADKGVAKWRRTAAEAAKQSRRPRIPVVAELAGTAEVADRIRATGLAVLLHEDAETALAEVLAPGATSGRHAEPAVSG